MTNSNSLFFRALNKERLKTPPIWYMRQAGRYMPEYRAVRKKFSNFLDMCKNPEVCCELALQPINAFDLDAAILFSDILTIPDALGLGVNFVENEGPVFNNPINNSKDIKNLNLFNPDDLKYVYQAVTNIKNSLPNNIPLIGFSGSPWTLAAYSIEGRSSKDFKKTLNFINANADYSHTFLNTLTDACFLYLREQVKAGADVIQIFDSWAGLLLPEDLLNFCYIPNLKIVDFCKEKKIPVMCFPKGIGKNYKEFNNKSNMKKSKRVATEKDIEKMFKIVDGWLNDPDLISVGHRRHFYPPYRNKSYVENTLAHGAVAIDGEKLQRFIDDVNFTLCQYGEDVNFNFEYMTRGYKNRITDEFCAEMGFYQKGGVNEDRNAKTFKESHDKLMDEWPEYVTLKEESVVRETIGEITEYKYNWRKAYNDGIINFDKRQPPKRIDKHYRIEK